MADNLRQLGYLPTSYDAAIAILPSVLLTIGPDAIVDWILVELRDATDPTTVVTTEIALLKRDGDRCFGRDLEPPNS